MRAYPVYYVAERPARFTRLQLLIRLLAFLVLGLIGISLGLVFLVLYLGLPVLAAVRLGGGRDASAYLEEDGPKVATALRWVAAVFAWFGLVSDRLPQRAPDETVRIHIEASGAPSPAPGSALVRILSGLPSGFVLWLLAVVGFFVWLWSAIRVLVSESVGPSAHAYLAGLQRWMIRLLAYQASLVEAYPPFSFEDAPPPADVAEGARVA